MQEILFAWVGNADLAASDSQLKDLGPIAQAATDRKFDLVFCLSSHAIKTQTAYTAWLQRIAAVEVDAHHVKLSSPTNFAEIFVAARAAVERVERMTPGPKRLTFHTSPGTPAMAAVWIVLAKTSYPATLLETSIQQGTKEVEFPFDLMAEFLPDLQRRQDEALARIAAGQASEHAAFGEIAHRCDAMQRVINQSERIAARDVPVLIQGESGTGKELFARAIHNASPRKSKPFIAVNCGAIPLELVDAEFFGYAKGAFTGASQSRKGHFEEASGGTIFLDEIGELPLASQVKLLRVLQEGKVRPLGTTQEVKVDVRVISATNRNLLDEIVASRFREDLFHRIGVGILQLPPLRERGTDLALLIDRLMEVINVEAAGQPGYKSKKLSVGARKLLLSHHWPGNIRELRNTLLRASLWADGVTIQAADVSASLLRHASRESVNLLDRPLGDGFDVAKLVHSVEERYVRRALDEARGNKTKAAELLGLASYQTLSNWMQRLGIET